MKSILVFLLPVFLTSSLWSEAQNKNEKAVLNPLASYSPLWNQQKFMDCNTGANTSYFSEKEKEVLWILNMLRLDPQLFLETVLLNPDNPEYMKPAERDDYFLSLMKKMKNLSPCTQLLVPNRDAYQSALCHATTSGKTGYVGHDRKSSCKADFSGECCDYGNEEPLDILLDLIIDRDVPSLGHRFICLSPYFNSIGISIQPHKGYGVNCVLDFK